MDNHSFSDLVSDLGSDQLWDRGEHLDQNHLLLQQTDEGYYDELIKLKKSHKGLQEPLGVPFRELLITHKRCQTQLAKPPPQKKKKNQRWSVTLFNTGVDF